MNKKPNPEMIDEECPEWTEDDFKNAMSFSELKEEIACMHRNLQKKLLVVPTIRLNEEPLKLVR